MLIPNKNDYVCVFDGCQKRFLKVLSISNNGCIWGRDKNKICMWTHASKVTKIK